jgi:signal transduction histidine kinase/CheY-like chemotaxis protein
MSSTIFNQASLSIDLRAANLAMLEDRIVALEREVARHRETEHALRDEVRLLRAVIDQMPSAVVVTEGSSAKVLLANEACVNILQRPVLAPGQTVDFATRVGFYEDGRKLEPHEWPLARVIRTGEQVDGETIRTLRDDGADMYFRVKAASVRDEDGTPIASVAICDDITHERNAQRHAEQAAQCERERFKHLFAQAPALIEILRGPDHVYEFSNAAATQLYGEDSLGKSIREVLPSVDRARLELLDCVLATGERCVGVEVPSLRDWDKNGQPYERFFNFVYEPYRDAEGRVEGVMSFGFDVTDLVLGRRKVEAVVRELETASRTKDEFLATVSHELRTPLNAILGWVQMLRSDTLPEAKKARAIETIERNAFAQAQLIEDLLDVSRIISGKLRLELGTVDLPAVVDNAVEAVRPAVLAKGLTLKLAIDHGVAPTLGDADRLRQVVWNLLTNAVKFTPRGGEVEVRLHQIASTLEVSVSDSGQGIDPAFLPFVFERFRQADGSTTRKHGGLGLGLAIVRHLVELHGGTVKVDSKGIGQGATFFVRLPLSPERSLDFEKRPALCVTMAPPFQARRQLAGVHVLVVDDEPDARELLAELLASCQAKVTCTGTAADALRLVETERPHVIVSDIGMPGEDGYSFIHKLRMLPPERGGKTPAVALTAYVRFEDRAKALVAGFNMHVPKPVEPTELLSALTNLETLYRERA